MPDALSEELVASLHGPHAINNSLNTAPLQGMWNFQPDRPLTTRQDFDGFNVWYEVEDGAVSKENQTYKLSTGTTAGGRAVMETAQLGIYRSGTQCQMAAGVWVDTAPTGDGHVDIAYTREGQSSTDDFLGWRITSDDLKFRVKSNAHPEAIFSQSAGDFDEGAVRDVLDGQTTIGRLYGLDPMDGGGPSKVTWTAGRGYVYGLSPGWYGPSATFGFVKDVGDIRGSWVQRAWPVFMYRPFGDPAIERPNQPCHIAVDNGTEAEDVVCRLGGRQFSVNGSVKPAPEPTFHWATGATVPMDDSGAGDTDWYVIGVVKRKSGFGATAVGLEEMTFSTTSEPLAVQYRVVDEDALTGQGTGGAVEYSAPGDQAVSQTALEVNWDSSTPSNVSIDTFTDSDSAVKPEGVVWDGDQIGAAQQFFTGVAGSVGGGFNFPLVREHPTVVLATMRSGTSDDVDSSFRLNESG